MDIGSYDGPYTTFDGPPIKQMGEGIKPALNLILPVPTYPVSDLKKKSHARKQPAGHIPRPRNAFILFRCDFVRQKKIPESVENDHRNISRIIGKIWHQMSDEQKEPWKKMAEQEKVNHHISYPNYKFATGPSNRKKSKRGDDIAREIQKGGPPKEEEDVGILQRSESCPPGTLLVPQAIIENNKPAYGDPLTTRDDLSRRPSRVKLYRSAPYDLDADGQFVGYFDDLVHQHYFAQATTSNEVLPLVDKKDQVTNSGDRSLFRGPRLDDVHYPIPDSTTPPEWEAGSTPLDLDRLYEAGFSRHSAKSTNINHDHFLKPSDANAIFNDPFNPVSLTSLSHADPSISLEGTHSINSLSSNYIYGRTPSGHGHHKIINQTTHLDLALLQEEDRAFTSGDLADDISSRFSRKLHMAASRQEDSF